LVGEKRPIGRREREIMKKFKLKKPETLDPAYGIPAELEPVQIRIHSEPTPAIGTVFFEGSVRKFVLERLPTPALTQMMAKLLEEPTLSYRLSTETIHITRL
jgi:hypothetical protein